MMKPNQYDMISSMCQSPVRYYPTCLTTTDREQDQRDIRFGDKQHDEVRHCGSEHLPSEELLGVQGLRADLSRHRYRG